MRILSAGCVAVNQPWILSALLSQLVQMAAQEQIFVAEKTVQSLQEAVGQKAQANGSRIQEILNA